MHLHVEWCDEAIHEGDLLGLIDDGLRKGAFNDITRYHAGVASVCAPPVKKLAGEATLESTGAGHDHGRPHIIEAINALEWRDVLEIKWVGGRELCTDAIIHGVDVGLIDGHAAFGEGGGIVDGDVVELGMGSPVLIQDEEKLLGAAEGKGRDENTASLGDR